MSRRAAGCALTTSGSGLSPPQFEMAVEPTAGMLFRGCSGQGKRCTSAGQHACNHRKDEPFAPAAHRPAQHMTCSKCWCYRPTHRHSPTVYHRRSVELSCASMTGATELKKGAPQQHQPPSWRETAYKSSWRRVARPALARHRGGDTSSASRDTGAPP